MGHSRNGFFCAFLAAVICVTNFAMCQTEVRTSDTPSRILTPIDNTRLVRIAGNTPPQARPRFDQGAVDPAMNLNRMVLVLQRSPEQELALTKFMAAQLNPSSPDFHHWLTPTAFGQIYGPSAADMAKITGWLESQGFSIYSVSAGRVTIEFSGTAAQVESAFHTRIHNFTVNSEHHIANISDPQIPEALAPVVLGVASLHNFFPRHQSVWGGYVKKDRATGKITPMSKNPGQSPSAGKGPHSDLGYIDQNTGYEREEVTPYDFAKIYNLLPLWNAGINGKGQTIAISGVSDVNPADIATFRSSFGLSANPITTIHNGTDPGYVSGAQGENTLDTEWSGATAPGATIALVVSASTETTFGGQLSDSYIVDKKTATIFSASYGSCELELGSTANSAYNSLYQQGATEGISIFESAGDQGSAGCESQDTPAPNAAQTGLQVNGLASSPYVTAVGGTDLNWLEDYDTYWSSTNASNGSDALGYIQEGPWNSTCANTFILTTFFPSEGTSESFCNDAVNGDPGLVLISAGSGGVSKCTSPTGTLPADCAGGWAKPAWQTGTGVPKDGKRDLPDVSLFASGGFDISTGIPGSAYLFCQASSSPEKSCDYTNPDYIIYQEIGGTSASSPALAGIMALVQQKVGSAQGLANAVFYQLAAKENLSNCNSANVPLTGSACVFYDITSGTNSQVCYTGSPNCVTNTSGDQVGLLSGYSAGTGYDLATGLGSVNATNLVNAWPGASGLSTTTAFTVAPGDSFGVGTTATLTATVTAGSKKPGAGSVTFSVEGVALGSATVNASGVATLSASSNGLTPGSYPIVATYGGTSGYGASTSPTVTVSLTKAATSAAITASATSVTPPAKITLTATIKRSASGAKGTPTGSVTFSTGSTALATINLNSSGVATLTASTAGYPAGTYPVIAKYNGDSSDANSTSTAVNVTLK
jgi:subtilase family serine protease